MQAIQGLEQSVDPVFILSETVWLFNVIDDPSRNPSVEERYVEVVLV